MAIDYQFNHNSRKKYAIQHSLVTEFRKQQENTSRQFFLLWLQSDGSHYF